MERNHDTLRRLDLIRIDDQVLNTAAELLPPELRSLDAIRLATAHRLGTDLRQVVTYDDRMADAAIALGFKVAKPS